MIYADKCTIACAHICRGGHGRPSSRGGFAGTIVPDASCASDRSGQGSGIVRSFLADTAHRRGVFDDGGRLSRDAGRVNRAAGQLSGGLDSIRLGRRSRVSDADTGPARCGITCATPALTHGDVLSGCLGQVWRKSLSRYETRASEHDARI